jgi:hypothetical protein
MASATATTSILLSHRTARPLIQKKGVSWNGNNACVQNVSGDFALLCVAVPDHGRNRFSRFCGRAQKEQLKQKELEKGRKRRKGGLMVLGLVAQLIEPDEFPGRPTVCLEFICRISPEPGRPKLGRRL